MDLMTAMIASKLAGLTPSGGGGGGVTDYNKLDNKPVGETITYGDTLTWDGNTDGLVSVVDIMFKVSDAVLTKEDCANGLSFTFAGETFTLSGEEAQSAFADDGFCITEYVALVPTDNYDAGDDLVFPEAGVYFVSADGMTVTELGIPGYTFTNIEIKKLDKKFLPPMRMVVNFTRVDDKANGDATADKTAVQIVAAVNAGIPVEGRVVYSGHTTIMPLVLSPVDATGLTTGSLAFCAVLNGDMVRTAWYTKTEDGIDWYTVNLV